MTTSGIAPPQRSVAVFDLDGTLTFSDTLVQFLAAFLRRRPRRSLGLWRLPFAVIEYAADGGDRGLLKSRVIRMIMRGESRTVIDACAKSFVNMLAHRRQFSPAALAVLETHRAAGDHLVLLSASPDLYVPLHRPRLRVRAHCVHRDRMGLRSGSTGRCTPRIDGERKSCAAWNGFAPNTPALPVVAYGNSASDLDHMRRAEQVPSWSTAMPARPAPCCTLGNPHRRLELKGAHCETNGRASPVYTQERGNRGESHAKKSPDSSKIPPSEITPYREYFVAARPAVGSPGRRGRFEHRRIRGRSLGQTPGALTYVRRMRH